jgi:hypothetical protein
MVIFRGGTSDFSKASRQALYIHVYLQYTSKITVLYVNLVGGKWKRGGPYIWPACGCAEYQQDHVTLLIGCTATPQPYIRDPPLIFPPIMIT